VSAPRSCRLTVGDGALGLEARLRSFLVYPSPEGVDYGLRFTEGRLVLLDVNVTDANDVHDVLGAQGSALPHGGGAHPGCLTDAFRTPAERRHLARIVY